MDDFIYLFTSIAIFNIKYIKNSQSNLQPSYDQEIQIYTYK